MATLASHLLLSGFLPSCPLPASQSLPLPPLPRGPQALPDEIYDRPSHATPILNSFPPTSRASNEFSCEAFFALYPDGGRHEAQGKRRSRVKPELVEIGEWGRERWSSRAIESQVYERAGLVDVKEEDERQNYPMEEEDDQSMGLAQESSTGEAPDEGEDGGENQDSEAPVQGQKQIGVKKKESTKDAKKKGTTKKKKKGTKGRHSEVLRLQRSLGTAGWTDSREIMSLTTPIIILDDENDASLVSIGDKRKAQNDGNELSTPESKKRRRLKTSTRNTPKSTRSKNRTLIQSSLITPPRRTRRLKSTFADLLKPPRR